MKETAKDLRENHDGKQENPFVGMWKDREDMLSVDSYLRDLRKGRLEKRL